MGKYTRSPSQLKSVTSCGERYRLERLVKPKPQFRPAAWTALGIAFHDTFQEWENVDRSLSISDLLNLFVEIYDQQIETFKEKQPDLRVWQLPPGTKSTENSIENYRNRGITKDVPLYFKRCLEAEWEVMTLPDGSKALELPFELQFESAEEPDDIITVKGQIDRIQWWPKDQRATLEDTKTGRADDDDNDPRQLMVYRLGALEYDIPVQYARYWFTKLDRGSEWFDLSKYDTVMVGDDYRKLDVIINSNLLLAKPGKQCELCSVRPWCSIQGWKKLGEDMYAPED